jgi:hypothetical protein
MLRTIMRFFRHTPRVLAFAALSCALSTAHASFSFSTLSGANTAATFAASVNGSIDTFNDLTINSDLGTASLNRAAGTIGYSVSTQTNLYTVQTNVIGGSSLTVDGNTDTLTFANFSAPVVAFGVRFFLSELTAGNAVAGSMTVSATDVNGLSQSYTYNQTVSAGEAIFLRLTSTAALSSVELVPPTPPVFPAGNPNVFATADNLVLAAVPEPETYALMLAGLGLLGFVARRRRQSVA